MAQGLRNITSLSRYGGFEMSDTYLITKDPYERLVIEDLGREKLVEISDLIGKVLLDLTWPDDDTVLVEFEENDLSNKN